MTYYIFSYDAETGIGLGTSISNSTYDLDLAAISSSGAFCLAELPFGFTSAEYKADLDRLGLNELPLYIIERYTGYAYDHSGDRVSNADIEAESRPESIVSDSYLEYRGIGMGDTVTVGSGSGSSGSETPSESSDLTEEQREVYEAEVAERMSGISSGRSVLVNIGISGGEGNGWTLDSISDKYIRTISDDAITPSTVLCVTGINREALKTHIYWKTEEGQITFSTDRCPSRDILINGWLFETGDEWSAQGVIEAWPASGITSRRYRQSLQSSGEWSITLSAQGTTNDSVAILTPADFGDAKLLFATPEYTGNKYAVIPHIYVDESTHRLAYRLTNVAAHSITITEVSLRLCYLGVVSGIVDDSADDASFEPYITEVDIDTMTAD